MPFARKSCGFPGFVLVDSITSIKAMVTSNMTSCCPKACLMIAQSPPKNVIGERAVESTNNRAAGFLVVQRVSSFWSLRCKLSWYQDHHAESLKRISRGSSLTRQRANLACAGWCTLMEFAYKVIDCETVAQIPDNA